MACAGSMIDFRYRLLREIASGGGGMVFEAEHVHTRARVAVKTLNHAAPVRGGRSRILREAYALGLVRHPNIVPVLDAGDCLKHGPYLVLAMIDGRTLESFVTGRSRLDGQSTVAIIEQIGSALSVLSRRSVVHRDVKPSNVLVVPGECGEPDTAVLIDFGVARLNELGTTAVERLTLDGDLVGTPEYMAPEQISGKGPIDHRTDVYGLGALAYECLTGTTPFAGHALAVVSSILAGDKPLPVSAHRSDIPAALEAAIARALHHDPAGRWPDTRSFARACAAAIGGGVSPLYLFPRNLEHSDTERPGVPSRKATRAPYQAPARVLMPKGTGYDGKIEDISAGGLLLATAVDLPPLTSVLVKFPLPMSGRVVTLDALVRWTRPRKEARAMGLEFSNPPFEVKREIEVFTSPLYG